MKVIEKENQRVAKDLPTIQQDLVEVQAKLKTARELTQDHQVVAQLDGLKRKKKQVELQIHKH